MKSRKLREKLPLAILFAMGFLYILFYRKVNMPKELFAVFVTTIVFILLQMISWKAKFSTARSVSLSHGISLDSPNQLLRLINTNKAVYSKIKKRYIQYASFFLLVSFIVISLVLLFLFRLNISPNNLVSTILIFLILFPVVTLFLGINFILTAYLLNVSMLFREYFIFLVSIIVPGFYLSFLGKLYVTAGIGPLRLP